MAHLRLTLVAASLCLLAACETTPPPRRAGASPPPRAAAFSREDFAWSRGRGTGRIEGRMTYRSRSGTFACANQGVALTPETPWVRRRMDTLYQSVDRAVAPAAEVRARTPPGPDYSAFVRTTTCDAQSRFAFSGVPDGAWYVITTGRAASGGIQLAFMRRVTIRNGAVVRIEL